LHVKVHLEPGNTICNTFAVVTTSNSSYLESTVQHAH
jgi:hypothetical protein